MNANLIRLKSFGLTACAFAFGAGLHAQTPLPAVSLFATDPTALAGTSGGSFTLVRRGDTNSPLTVNVTVSGTASNGVDYAAIGSVLTIPAGFYAVDIPVQPIVDTANRGNKTVVLALQSNASYEVPRFAWPAVVKIVDDVFDLPPPTVSLLSPTNGSVFTSPAQITLQAAASDPDLPIASVSFYADDVLLGKSTNSPYTFVWHRPHTGRYALFVRAVDTAGKSAVSSVSDITVADAPVVTLSLPEGTNYTVGQVVEFDAQIGDSSENIKSVTFYVNGKVVGTSTTAPFTFEWNATKVGTYHVQATATDKNTNKSSASQKIDITVTPYVGGA